MGKRAIVTGANTGIGKEIARGLAAQGYQLIMACRSRERGETAREEIVEQTGNREVTVRAVDLANLASIREFAGAFCSEFERLDLLVNNAGVTLQEFSTTADGFETVFGVNFLGPFLLTNLLLAPLKAAAPARIVTVASSVHTSGHIDRGDPQMRQDWQNRKAYSNSKLADVLFTRELARRLDGSGVTTNCFNPGLVRSEFFRAYDPVPFMLRVALRLLGKTPEQGADTGVYLATAAELDGRSSGYYERRRLKEPSTEAQDPDLSRWLWEYAEGQVGLDQEAG